MLKYPSKHYRLYRNAVTVCSAGCSQAAAFSEDALWTHLSRPLGGLGRKIGKAGLAQRGDALGRAAWLGWPAQSLREITGVGGRFVAKPGTDVMLAGAEQRGAMSRPTVLSILGENLLNEVQDKLLALFVSPSSAVTFIPAQISRGV